MQVLDTLLCEFVDVGRNSFPVTVTGEIIPACCVKGDEQNIGSRPDPVSPGKPQSPERDCKTTGGQTYEITARSRARNQETFLSNKTRLISGNSMRFWIQTDLWGKH